MTVAKTGNIPPLDPTAAKPFYRHLRSVSRRYYQWIVEAR
jgi:hypothetical protein